MARNGSGTMALLATMAPANTVSNSATVNSIMEDIADAITDSINKDGTKAFEANQSMGGFKLTSVGAGTATGDAANAGQVQSGILNSASAVGGTADAITITMSPATAAWTNKETFTWVSGGANTITNPTINKDSLGAKTIKKGASAALAVGDTGASGYVCRGYYNGTDVILLNPATAGLTAASTTEVLTGTATDRAGTPDAIAALWEKGSDVASAGTLTLGEGGYFHVTGTTTITDIDFGTAKDGRKAILVFDGVLTLTHNSTTLVCPTGASITTAAGDTCLVVQDSSDNIKVAWYQRADGTALTTSGGGIDFLGTITTTSGNTASLGSLTLTDYKFVEIVWNGVSTSITPQPGTIGNSTSDDVTFSQTLAIATSYFGITRIDLNTGIGTTCIGAAGYAGVTTAFDSAITTASTQITVTPDANAVANFDAGSMRVYGLK